jgi:hypothetical protein
MPGRGVMAMQTYLAMGVAAGMLGCGSPLEVDRGGPGDSSPGSSPACAPSVAEVPYSTVAELDALVVGRWARCDGPPQLQGEGLGVEFTEGRVVFPLERASNGAVERVPPVTGVGPESWVALIDEGRPLLVFMWASSPSKSMTSIVIDGPSFFDGAEQMFLPYAPGGATYARLEP